MAPNIGDFVFALVAKAACDGTLAFIPKFHWRMREEKGGGGEAEVAAGIDPREHKRAVKEEEQAKRLLLSRRLPEIVATNQKWSEDHAERVKRVWRIMFFSDWDAQYC